VLLTVAKAAAVLTSAKVLYSSHFESCCSHSQHVAAEHMTKDASGYVATPTDTSRLAVKDVVVICGK
jgi:hypothetical protein